MANDRKQNLNRRLVHIEDYQTILDRVDEEQWEDALDAALEAYDILPRVVNYRDFRERWKIRMRYKGIDEISISMLLLMSRPVFEALS